MRLFSFLPRARFSAISGKYAGNRRTCLPFFFFGASARLYFPSARYRLPPSLPTIMYSLPLSRPARLFAMPPVRTSFSFMFLSAYNVRISTPSSRMTTVFS